MGVGSRTFGRRDSLWCTSGTERHRRALFATFTGDTQRYNLDGTPKPNKSPTFWVVGARVAYQWNKTVSTYLGINNILDYQQAKKDSYLWLDVDGNLEVKHIWGPNIGRTFAAAVKVAF